jgi:hypothetical protein
MAGLVLLNATPYVAGYDFTADSNKLTLDATIADLDTTTFSNTGWRSRTGGLKDSSLHLEGLWSGPQDAESFPALGTVDQVMTVSPTGVATSVAYMGQVGKFKYATFDQIGALMPFALDAMGSNMVGLVRGQLAAAKQTVSATGALTPTTGVNLGAVGAAQWLYATFHVFSPAGTTITAVVESATSNAFSSPTTRATIGPITTVGGTWATRVAGSITDTWYRIRISAITGTFSVAAGIGVQ